MKPFKIMCGVRGHVKKETTNGIRCKTCTKKAEPPKVFLCYKLLCGSQFKTHNQRKKHMEEDHGKY